MSHTPAGIGKYRIERELGRGASGVVYLAYDTFRETWVAVKQIHPHLLQDPAQAAKYRRLLHNEATLAGQINHPHIVSLVDGRRPPSGVGGVGQLAGRPPRPTPCAARGLTLRLNAAMHWNTPTFTVWCTAISNPPTCCCATMVKSS
jgi:serine/threonine protein kinase